MLSVSAEFCPSGVLRSLNILLGISSSIWMVACWKFPEPRYTGRVYFDRDTLFVDTLFSQLISTTYGIRIYNPDPSPIQLARIRVGAPGRSFLWLRSGIHSGQVLENVWIEEQDSIYLWIGAVSSRLPDTVLRFLYVDSILLEDASGNVLDRLVVLVPLRNAWYRGWEEICNEVWSPPIPVVLVGPIHVDTGCVLRITAGTHIFASANAYLLISGELRAYGNVPDSPVIFEGIRLDEPYRRMPGQWPGIFLEAGSGPHILHGVWIQEAYIGLFVQGTTLSLVESMVRNCLGWCIYAENSVIQAVNVLVAESGERLLYLAGARFQGYHLTLAGYENPYLTRNKPAVYLTPQTSRGIRPVSFSLINSILWGNQTEELEIDSGYLSWIEFGCRNCILQTQRTLSPPEFVASQQVDPQFQDPAGGNYRLHPGSPAIDLGIPLSFVRRDLDGNFRDDAPDLGCYELPR